MSKEEMIRVYISGPMTGYAHSNREAFNAAEDLLRNNGYDPINPSSNGLSDDAPWEQHMRADLRMLLQADAVAALDGWERSKGARIEIGLAQDLNMLVQPLYNYVE